MTAFAIAAVTIAGAANPTPPDDEEAIAPLRERLEANPADAGAWRELGWRHWHGGRLDEARRVWETWRHIEPERAEIYDLLGRVALAENRLEDAIREFRRARAAGAREPDLLFQLARALRWHGRLGEATELLRELRAGAPDDFDIRLELARALSSNWEHAEALPLWSQLRGERPDDRDIRLGEARALLQTGAPRAAELAARRVLRREPHNREALEILIDAADYGGRPAEAAESIESLLPLLANATDRREWKLRLLAVRARMLATAPSEELRRRQVDLARRILAASPRSPDARMLLAEQLLAAGKHAEARAIAWKILREFNPRHLRARALLFEIALARRRLDEARAHLEGIRAFDPSDPYLEYHEARLAATAGDYAGADRALDRLAAAGARGAAAVLLYHALTPGAYGPALSVARFREHLQALMDAGYTFLTPSELHGFWERLGPRAGLHPSGRLRRVAIVTFDDALESAMRFGTPVGRDYGLRFGQFIPVGNIEQGSPYIADWKQLAAYAESGVWEFGSHLTYHDPIVVDRKGTRAYSAAARQWLEAEDRLETEAEFFERLRREYEHARAEIERHLGAPARALAYPYGEIGQEGYSNLDGVIAVNLHHAARNHDLAFIQTQFAHALRDGNPLLYGRHEFDQHVSGAEVAAYFRDRHPAALAGLTRLEFARWRGLAPEARRALRQLRDLGYDADILEHIETGLRATLAPAFAVPPGMPPAGGQPPASPPVFLGGTIEGNRDGLDAQTLRAGLRAETIAGANTHAAAHYGFGSLSQDLSGDGGRISLREQAAGLELTYRDARRWFWTLAGGARERSAGDDRRHFEGAFEGRGRLTPGLALRAGIAREIPDQAAAAARGLHYTRFFCESRWDIRLDWHLRLDAQRQEWSDDNAITDINAGIFHEPRAWRGLYAGARSAYRGSAADTPDYWTPKNLRSIHAVMGRHGHSGGGRYHLSASLGIGRETVFRQESPDGDSAVNPAWEGSYAFGGVWETGVGDDFSAGINAAYQRGPRYWEARGALYGRYAF